MEYKVKSNENGFTLIEVMIVVAIVGIITLFAYPAYQDYVKEARRVDAQSLLLDAQLKQERYRSYNNTYSPSAASLAAANLGLAASTYYNITTSGAANTYTVTATVIAGTPQADDTEGGVACSPLEIDEANNQTPAACWKN
ncbi:type IV pilin protein [uncultured Neptuniibacter sp.]|uniref:type IV pilin protein n=1 Tax=uncultured Neptuniibacter sp. TaxID=502143 RepID=UPI0026242DB9|nr:type IV pilin protein [uncultured Neptuniibacter sp.]